MTEKELWTAIDGILDYCQHDGDCILSQWHAGEPRPDGSYWALIGKTWYQQSPVNQLPKCNCGMQEAVNKINDCRRA